MALSLPLGAGRLTREWLPDDPPGRRRVAMLRDWLATEIADAGAEMLKAGSPDLAVATSKTFRSLARLTGAAPSGEGPRVKRTLTATGLRQLIAFISRMTAADRAELEGVSAERAPQIVAGALVAEASMRALAIRYRGHLPLGIARRADSAETRQRSRRNRLGGDVRTRCGPTPAAKPRGNTR